LKKETEQTFQNSKTGANPKEVSGNLKSLSLSKKLPRGWTQIFQTPQGNNLKTGKTNQPEDGKKNRGTLPKWWKQRGAATAKKAGKLEKTLGAQNERTVLSYCSTGWQNDQSSLAQ